MANTNINIMKSALVRFNPGDKILHNGEKVEFLDAVITPNGINNPELVAIIYARRNNGNTISATADRFKICEDEEYETWYPTPHHSKFTQ